MVLPEAALRSHELIVFFEEGGPRAAIYARGDLDPRISRKEAERAESHHALSKEEEEEVATKGPPPAPPGLSRV